jgi:hypothetical protein
VLEAARNSDLALSFEGPSATPRQSAGAARARGVSSQRQDRPFGPIFKNDMGDGAIFEACIVVRFTKRCTASNTRRSASVIVGGTTASLQEPAAGDESATSCRECW